MRRRRGRKRARGSRTPMPVPLRPNQRWKLDFLSDTFGACRKFRILAVDDDCCRENLCLVADTSISGARVARELDALVRIYGIPACIVSDNDRVHEQGHPEMGKRQQGRVALHRAKQAAAEWLHRVVQRKPARRMQPLERPRHRRRRPCHIKPKGGTGNSSLAELTQQCRPPPCYNGLL